MEYFVALNKEELTAALILKGKNEFEDLIFVPQDYSVREDIAEEMLKKGFIQEEEGKRSWNSFVNVLLHNAFNADSVIRSYGADGSKCYIFFKNDVMILLCHRADREEYVFYYVPYLPKAMGGFSSHYRNLEAYSSGSCKIEESEFEAENAPVSTEQLKETLCENGFSEVSQGDVLMTIRGVMFEDTLFFGTLFNYEKGLVFAQAEDRYIKVESVNYYDLMARIAKWVIGVQGSCIKYGERV